MSVPSGETVELTWTFDGETEGLLYGCHEPGHYEAGMVGDIVVEG
ncbi:MAG TPA: plastocyanin/azurin family copper-binding protein [Euzebyales bacterium]|nr:plastocyanin/azurin family copper-binding protein [Euzebyales bacterium]